MIDRKSLGLLLSGLGLNPGPESLSRIGDRVASALALVAARAPSFSPQVKGRPAAPGQNAVSAYERLAPRRPKGGAADGRARFLAVLEGLFAEAGLDLDPESLASLDEGLGNGGGESGASGDLAGNDEDADASGEDASGQGYRDGAEASAFASVDAKEPASPTELDSLVAMLKDFFGSTGEGPNDWQAFNQRETSRDPSWRLVPFAFSANGIEFEGVFRIFCRRNPKAVISLGADFRSNGHYYSFSLRGSSLSLEGPGEGIDGREAELRALGRSLDELGIGLTFSALRGIEAPRGAGEDTWA